MFIGCVVEVAIMTGVSSLKSRSDVSTVKEDSKILPEPESKHQDTEPLPPKRENDVSLV